jgi:hypothetical protein
MSPRSLVNHDCDSGLRGNDSVPERLLDSAKEVRALFQVVWSIWYREGE